MTSHQSPGVNLKYAISEEGRQMIKEALETGVQAFSALSSGNPHPKLKMVPTLKVLHALDHLPELPDEIDLYRMIRATGERSHAGIAKKLAGSLRTSGWPSAEQVNGWRPIESAPKISNGPRIMIGNASWAKTVTWSPSPRMPRARSEGKDFWLDTGSLWQCETSSCDATHWRPYDMPEVCEARA